MGETRTLKGLLPLAPKASAYTGSATMAYSTAIDQYTSRLNFLGDSGESSDDAFDSLDFICECSFISILTMMSGCSAIGLTLLIKVEVAFKSLGLGSHIAMETRVSSSGERSDKTQLTIFFSLKRVSTSPEQGNSRIGWVFDEQLHSVLTEFCGEGCSGVVSLCTFQSGVGNILLQLENQFTRTLAPYQNIVSECRELNPNYTHPKRA